MISEITIGEVSAEYVSHATLVAKINELIRAQNAVELAATDSQQLQAVIAELRYIESVVGQYGMVSGSKCHEMLSRSIQRLTAMQ